METNELTTLEKQRHEIAPLFFKVIENDMKNVYLPESFYVADER